MMKRIIAAALSVLVGAFGYNIVDKALEDRVATLESEVVDLREEVSKYHPQNNGATSTGLYEESQEYTTEIYYETTKLEGSTGIQVGDYLYESSNSIRKFLIREYNDGRYKYIPSYNYEPISLTQKQTLTGQVFAPKMVTTTNDYVVDLTTSDDVVDLPTTTAQTTRHYTTNDDVFDLATTAAQTTQPYVTNEYFVYLTDVTAQWTETEEETSYSYSYDKDYSLVSKKYVEEKNYITVKYKGYTDSQLAGTKISFAVLGHSYWDDYSWKPISVSDNMIDENGCFEFEATYCRNYYVDSFYISSVTIK